MGEAVGQGLPGWLDTDLFLSAAETRALGEKGYRSLDGPGVCPRCGRCGSLDPAHMARKGLGGQPGGSGPVVWVCRSCHRYVDNTASVTFAVERAEAVPCLVYEDGTVRHLRVTDE